MADITEDYGKQQIGGYQDTNSVLTQTRSTGPLVRSHRVADSSSLECDFGLGEDFTFEEYCISTSRKRAGKLGQIHTNKFRLCANDDIGVSEDVTLEEGVCSTKI